MYDALKYHRGVVNIGGNAIAILCYADAIDGLASGGQDYVDDAGSQYFVRMLQSRCWNIWVMVRLVL